MQTLRLLQGRACGAIVLLFLIVSGCSHTSAQSDLLRSFHNPPQDARPTLWWRFMNDLATREGVVADLDSMSHLGLSGAVISFCDNANYSRAPQPGLPSVTILSQEWWSLLAYTIKEASQRHLTLWFQACPGYATSAGPWITPELSMQKLVWSEVDCEGGRPVETVLPRPAVDKTWNYYRDIATLAFPKEDTAIAPNSVLDLTSRVDVQGKLAWEAPPGRWTIIRLGHTTTGTTNHPATFAGTGLECDKLSREATRVIFDNYFRKILTQQVASGVGTPQLFYDSWEAGTQNWTPRLRDAFRERRGYDPLPWLLIVTGKLVGDETLSRRFEYDWKKTIEELIDAEHFGELTRLAHENGAMQFRAQPYNGQTNFMTAGALFDLPEGEFWHVNKSYGWWTLRMIASVAHVNGKPYASAEALTASPEHIRFDVDPYSTKAETDLALAMGINRFALSIAAHNPWPDLKPGMIAGPYGPLLGPGQTWTPFAKSWIDYLSRCSHLLSQGSYRADVVTLFRPEIRGFEPPAGYASDICNEELIVSSMTVDNGVLHLPSGMQYRLLELPDTTRFLSPSNSPSGLELRLGDKPLQQSMSVALLRKVSDLVHAGATIVGPRPVSAPGLSGYPECDQEIARIAEDLWGPATNQPVVDRRVGKGRVVSGMTIIDLLASMGVQPDIETPDVDSAKDLPWIHRSLPEGELYFLSNQKDVAMKTTVSFRTDGKIPELLDATTGDSQPAAVWKRVAGRTEVSLELDPRGSIFVLFREDTQATSSTPSSAPVTLGTVQLKGPWSVSFSHPVGPSEPVLFDKLISWSERPEKTIRFYSGVATYRYDLAIADGMLRDNARIMLDLGDVKNLARVTINQRTFPELWKPPFCCDITGALKAGQNTLTIEVVNVWKNRLIGDEQEPADIEWQPYSTPATQPYRGRSIAKYPDWLIHDRPRPSTARQTFATWNYVKSDEPLLPAGLLGPVTITATRP